MGSNPSTDISNKTNKLTFVGKKNPACPDNFIGALGVSFGPMSVPENLGPATIHFNLLLKKIYLKKA